MSNYGTKAEITLCKRELLALLFKLDRPDSAAALIRLGEDGEEYLIQAISDEVAYKGQGVPDIHPKDEARIKFYKKFEEQEWKGAP